MDHERLSSELMRALRGRRSQVAFSRRLGYRSNVAYLWESGRAFPTAARFFAACARVGVEPAAALERFYRGRPAWLDDADLTQAAGPAALLSDLRGGTPVAELARAAARSRFAVGRWLKGEAEPRLPDFLRMVEATSLRLLDFVACLVDPAALPSVADEWTQLEAARRAAYEAPWSHAVLRALELSDYRSLPRHEPGWIAARIGIDAEAEQRLLSLLAGTGQIREQDGRWQPTEARTVDTRQDPEAARVLKAHWGRVATERLAAGAEGLFSYNLMGVSDADFARIEELQRSYFREVRAIVAQSQPVERIALVNLQLLRLG